MDPRIKSAGDRQEYDQGPGAHPSHTRRRWRIMVSSKAPW
jgi:hypothetical protein